MGCSLNDDPAYPKEIFYGSQSLFVDRFSSVGEMSKIATGGLPKLAVEAVQF